MRGPLRVVLWLVTAVAAVVLLFTIVFPWFSERFVTDPVLDGGGGAAGGGAAPATDVSEPFQPTPLGEVTEY